MTGDDRPKFAVPLIGQDDLVGLWVCSRTPGSGWTPKRGKCIGLLTQNGLSAGVIYEDYSGTNIFMHVAAIPGRRWMTRYYLWMVFHYPFVQLGCKRVTAGVPSTNQDSIRFVESLGFELEARLKDAYPNGDLLVYCLRKEHPKVQRLLAYGEGRFAPNVKAISPAAA